MKIRILLFGDAAADNNNSNNSNSNSNNEVRHQKKKSIFSLENPLCPNNKNNNNSSTSRSNKMRQLPKQQASFYRRLGRHTDLEVILANNTCKQFFKEFLAERYCIETILFWEEVEKFKSLENSFDRIIQAAQIINTFIIPGAPQEINASASEKGACIERYRTIENEFSTSSDLAGLTVPGDLFYKLQRAVIAQLKSDQYPQFINSEAFMLMIHEENFKDVINSAGPSLSLSVLSDKPILIKSKTLKSALHLSTQRQQSTFSSNSSDSDSKEAAMTRRPRSCSNIMLQKFKCFAGSQSCQSEMSQSDQVQQFSDLRSHRQSIRRRENNNAVIPPPPPPPPTTSAFLDTASDES